ncbi:MAG: pyridoxamine 5-phosphate oxidase family protein [Ferruginibacter sp.]|nr:pyridoxamine 5-phosphate oxidase family protein [Ferruginibacter sp.]
MTGELNDSQIHNILSSHVIGRLACTDGLQPYIVPVTFTFDKTYSANRIFTSFNTVPFISCHISYS